MNLNIIIIVISGDFKHSRTSFVNAFRSNIRCQDSVASLNLFVIDGARVLISRSHLRFTEEGEI